MSTKILISPYAARLPNGNVSPKNYPFWSRLVQLLNQTGYDVIQIGVAGEERVEGVGQFIQNWPFDKLRTLVNDCATWIAVDNFFPHFCHAERLKPGIVLFGPSDPRIFGYDQNVNLLRGRDYLRQFQYDTWMAVDPNPNAFIYAENIISEVFKLAPLPLTKQPASLSYASFA